MVFGPIFTYELLTHSRRSRYFVIRTLYGLVLLFSLLSSYDAAYAASMDVNQVARFSSAFFSSFANLQLVAGLLLAPAMAAGTIATERERRTIEYLFVADLKNSEIVLGKLVARLLEVFALLLVGIPVLALAMLLGGIAPEALIVAMVITASSVVTAVAISTVISVFSKRAREAVTRAFLVLLVLLIVPAMLYPLRSQTITFYDTFIAPVNQQLLAANPFFALNIALSAGSGVMAGTPADLVLLLLRNQAVVIVAAVALATLVVRRVHMRHRVVAPKRRARLMRSLRPTLGNAPMLWKELFAEPAAAQLGTTGRIAMIVLLIGVLGPTFFMFVSTVVSQGWNDPELYQGFATMMGTMVCAGLLLLIAVRAAGSVTSEKERGCWEALIVTPLSAHDIVGSKLLGSVFAARWGLAIVLVLWGLGVVVDPRFVVVVPFLMGTLLLLAVFAGLVGLTTSLTHKTTLRAMGTTLLIGIALGGGYFFCCGMFMIGGSGFELFFSPCITFLLACPAILYLSDFREAEMIGPYLVGMVGYLVISIVLWLNSVENFDRWVGRTEKKPSGFQPRKTPTRAEVVGRPAAGGSSDDAPSPNG